MAERVKPRSMFVEEAIQLALESRWEEALAVNEQLLERYGPDEDTYNRLGKAYLELGRLQEARDAYARTLELNPLNLIAQKNERKLAALLESPPPVTGSAQAIDVESFAEEPGKSALTVLHSPPDIPTAGLAPGDAIELDMHNSSLSARTTTGAVLGELEPRMARRLVPLMRAGNRYSAVVARLAGGRIEVMIREVYQSPENARKPSFPSSRASRGTDFRPYAKESLLAAREAEAIDYESDDEGTSTVGQTEPDDVVDSVDIDDEVDGGGTAPGGADGDDGEEEDEDGRPEDQY